MTALVPGAITEDGLFARQLLGLLIYQPHVAMEPWKVQKDEMEMHADVQGRAMHP